MGLAYTHQTISFAGIVIWGKDRHRKQIKLTSPVYYQHALNKFEIGDHLTVSVTNKRVKRTENQNRYYWGVYLPIIAQETGERDLERLHELFKKKFLTKEKVIVLGEEVLIGKSTTELSPGGFCEYILDIQLLTGIEAPPTENFDLGPLKPKSK